MFCRNCGKPIDPNAAVCINCGFSNGTGDNYCPNCGNATNVGMTYCTMCGASLVNQRPMVEQKSKLAGGLLGIFLGSLGVHNFCSDGGNLWNRKYYLRNMGIYRRNFDLDRQYQYRRKRNSAERIEHLKYFGILYTRAYIEMEVQACGLPITILYGIPDALTI